MLQLAQSIADNRPQFRKRNRDCRFCTPQNTAPWPARRCRNLHCAEQKRLDSTARVWLSATHDGAPGTHPAQQQLTERARPHRRVGLAMRERRSRPATRRSLPSRSPMASARATSTRPNERSGRWATRRVRSTSRFEMRSSGFVSRACFEPRLAAPGLGERLPPPRPKSTRTWIGHRAPSLRVGHRSEASATWIFKRKVGQ